MINVFGAKESAGLNIALAVVDFLTQVLLVIVGAVLVLGADPGQLAENVVWGVAPTWKNFILAIPIGMIAYTGIETISNMAEEARDEIRTIPAAIKRVAIAVFAIYFTLPAVALVALPVQQGPDGEYYTLLGPVRGAGRLRGRSDRGPGRQPEPWRVPDARRDLRRHPRRHDPVPGHQRGPDRRVAARVLDGHRPPVTGTNCADCTRAYRDTVDRDHRLRRRGDHHHAAGPGRVPRQHVRVRGDAVVHDRPSGADSGWRVSRPEIPRPYRPPGNVTWRGHDIPVFAVVGGLGTAAAFVVTVALHPDVAATGVGLAHARRRRLPALPARPGARPGLDAQGRDPAAGRRSRGRVRLRPGAAGGRSVRRVGDGHRGQAGGPAAARDRT